MQDVIPRRKKLLLFFLKKYGYGKNRNENGKASANLEGI